MSEVTIVASSEEIRERFSNLDRSGVTEDAWDEAEVKFVEGYGDIFDGIIIEASIPRLGLDLRNESWRDEADDARWFADARAGAVHGSR